MDCLHGPRTHAAQTPALYSQPQQALNWKLDTSIAKGSGSIKNPIPKLHIVHGKGRGQGKPQPAERLLVWVV